MTTTSTSRVSLAYTLRKFATAVVLPVLSPSEVDHQQSEKSEYLDALQEIGVWQSTRGIPSNECGVNTVFLLTLTE